MVQFYRLQCTLSHWNVGGFYTSGQWINEAFSGFPWSYRNRWENHTALVILFSAWKEPLPDGIMAEKPKDSKYENE